MSRNGYKFFGIINFNWRFLEEGEYFEMLE